MLKKISNVLNNEASKGQKLMVFIRYLFAHCMFLFRDGFPFTWLHGIKMSVLKGRTSTTDCYYFRYYDRDEFLFLERYIRPGDTFIDVGANIGSYSLLAASLGCNVLAFEPDASTCSVFERICNDNGFSKRIKIFQTAVGAEKKYVSFISGLDTTSRVSTDFEAGEMVQCIPLDKVTDEDMNVDILKIDVEGYELDVIKGAEALLRSNHTNIVIVEVLVNRNKIIEELGDFGFIPFMFDDGELREGDFYGRNNMMFYKNKGLVLDRINIPQAQNEKDKG